MSNRFFQPYLSSLFLSGSGPSSARTEHEHVTAELVDGASEEFTLPLGKTYVLQKIETDVAAWIRVYTSEAAQTADEAREHGEDILAGSGLIAEVTTGIGMLVIPMSPAPIGTDLEAVPSGVINITATNMSGDETEITITITALELES